ncbi:MAG: CoA-binding protein [Balneolaceae bacterium]
MRSTFNNWYDEKMRATPELEAITNRAEEVLEQVHTIAVVGISRTPHKDSHFVGRYLKKAGYRIVPVNPAAEEILGEKAYEDIESIPFEVDVVDIFLGSEYIREAVMQAIKKQPQAIWLQLGTGSHDELGREVEQAGIHFFQKRCIKVDHQFLIRPKAEQQN